MQVRLLHTFPVLLADRQVLYDYNVNRFPYKVLVSPEGRLIELGPANWEAEARLRFLGKRD